MEGVEGQSEMKTQGNQRSLKGVEGVEGAEGQSEMKTQGNQRSLKGVEGAEGQSEMKRSLKGIKQINNLYGHVQDMEYGMSEVKFIRLDTACVFWLF